MPFFPQSYLSPEPALFQILSALEDASSSPKSPSPASCHPRFQVRRAAPQQHFTPRFDVAETSSAYELYGEVPGLSQSDLVIEFSDAQTLVIKGKTQRPSVSSPEGKGKEVAHEQEPESTANENASETGSHHATVEDDEDEYDQADVPVATPATSTSTTTLTPASKEPETKQSEPQQPQQPKARYWVAERRVGEFARSFSFEQRIDQDGVRAELRNGVLHVTVPKNLRRAKVVVAVQ